MAKKPAAKKDRHKSTFVVRLPESFRALLDTLQAKTHRTYTVEVQLALRDHAVKLGEHPPEVVQ